MCVVCVCVYCVGVVCQGGGDEGFPIHLQDLSKQNFIGEAANTYLVNRKIHMRVFSA